ncbi:larval cuticle protein A3A-like [Copidosoma floridanum]|uniref:larval cuticle protein A3A-like n=1 Tax=Copidosoma floridanum TaxID=29053 RepID=UPI0006C997F1|nr:larval cuticle protein A3A-like [Copidosoma floridanum]
MVPKALVLLCFAAGLSAIQAGVVPVAVAPAPVLAKIESIDAHPRYSFAYDVQDSLTGDSKAQYETRDGDVVRGSYSLIEADGTRRIVDYTADDVNGFNAVVSREPAIVAAAPVVAARTPVAAPVVSAPVVAARAVASAPIARVRAVAAPLVARPVAAAPVVAGPAPVVGARAVAAPVLARTVAYSPIPRAVATRVGLPLAYSAYVV